MRAAVAVVAFVTMAAALGAVGASVRQDAGLSGQWTREAGNPAQGSGNGAGFGPSVTITHTGSEVTVQPTGGTPARYRADGTEDAQVISNAPCARRTRITRTTPGPREIRISTWLVRQNGCGHGESDLFQPRDPEDGPQAAAPNDVVRTRAPTRVLEAVTVISRNGDSLVVETTRPLPNGSTQTTTTRYRR